jgi:hypothetical protein
MQLGAVLAWKAHIGQNIVLALVHEVGQLGPTGAELLGDMTPSFACMFAFRLVESLPDRGSNDRVLAARDVGKGVAHPVNAAALPSGLEHAVDGRPEATVCVADHQLGAVEPTGFQAAQKVHPEGFRLGRPKAQANDFTPTVRVSSDRYYCRHADDPAALAHLEVCRIEPHVGPFPGKRAVQEFADAFIDVLAQLRDRAFGDARQPHRLRQFIDTAGGHAADPRLLDHGDQGLLRSLARLQEAGEIAALPQLRNLEVQRAQTGIECALSIPVAPSRTLIGPLVLAGADQAFDIGLHDQLQHSLGNGAKKIAAILLLKKLGKVHGCLGHRGLRLVRG